MFIQAYKAAFGVIRRKPLALWGYALLAGFISMVVGYYTSAIALPSLEMIFEGNLDYYFENLFEGGALSTSGIASFIGMCVGFLTTVGTARVFLVGLEGKEPTSDDFLCGFSNIKKTVGAMLWQMIWSLIWVMLAVAGLVFMIVLFAAIGGSVSSSILRVANSWGAFNAAGNAATVLTIIGVVLGVIVYIPLLVIAVIKGYSYSFVPYILATKPDITAGQALKLSKEISNGKKLHMWLADLIFGAAIAVTALILAGLCWIPFANIIFVIVAVAFAVAILLFAPVFTGLYRAEFFRLKPMPKAPKAPKVPNFNGAPQQGYGAPQQGYNAPQQSYNAPQQGYGAPQQNFNQNNQ